MSARRGSRWDPDAHAAARGLRVVETRLTGAWGAYLPRDRLVVLHAGMREPLRRWALAHELAHHEHGDTACADPVRAARAERLAEEWAAGHLVDRAGWDAACAVYEHPALVAAELDLPLHAVGVCARLFAGRPARA